MFRTEDTGLDQCFGKITSSFDTLSCKALPGLMNHFLQVLSHMYSSINTHL